MSWGLLKGSDKWTRIYSVDGLAQNMQQVIFLTNDDNFLWDHIYSITRPQWVEYFDQPCQITGHNNYILDTGKYWIYWTNAVILLIGHSGSNFSEILIEIHTLLFKKIIQEIWKCHLRNTGHFVSASMC